MYSFSSYTTKYFLKFINLYSEILYENVIKTFIQSTLLFLVFELQISNRGIKRKRISLNRNYSQN